MNLHLKNFRIVVLTLAVVAMLCATRAWQVASRAEVTPSGPSVRPMTICPLNTNLIVNGDAETDTNFAGDGFVDENVSAWDNEIGQFTVAKWGAPSGFPTTTDPGPSNRGVYMFVGGNAEFSSGTQVVDVSSCAGQIDSGGQQFNLSGYLGGFASQNDSPRVLITFKNASNGSIGTAVIGPVTGADRNNVTGMIPRTTAGTLPAGTRKVEVALQMTRVQGTYNDSYADNISFSLTSPTSCASLPSGAVGWFKGEGNANDSAAGHNGTLENGTYSNAIVGQGFNLKPGDGTLDQVSISDTPDFHPARFTIETWVRFDSLNSTGASAPGMQFIMFKKNTRSTNFEGFDLHKIRVSGVDKLSSIISSASGTSVTATSQTVVSTGQFYHVAATHDFDGVNGTLKLYVNGNLEASAVANFPPDYGTRPVFLGSSGETFNGYLDGVIDEASIYNRALSAAEIQSIFSAGPTGKCRPGAIQSLTLNPNPVIAGQSSTATVTLATPAPSGGTVLNLSSSNLGVATLPSSLLIPEGQGTGTFTVSTLAQSSDANVLITASDQTGSVSANLTVLTPKPDLIISTASGPPNSPTDTAFNVSWTIKNQGIGPANGPWTDRVFISTDNQLGGDTLLGEFPFSGTLDPSQTVDRIQTLTIPRNAVSQSGSYFLLVQTDATNQINESPNDNNNFIALPISVTRPSRPDLVVESIVAPSTAFFGQTILVQWTVKNIGGGPTNAATWRDFIYLSTDNVPEIEDPFKTSVNNISPLAAGESYTATVELKIPQGLVGQHKIIVWTDSDGSNHRSNNFPQQVIEEDNENNFGIARSIQLNAPPLPDLQTTNVVAPEEVFAGGQMALNWQVQNLGTAGTPPDQTSWVDKIYLSQDTVLDVNTDRLIGSRPRNGSLAQNASYTVTNFTVNAPANIAGDWFVFVAADGNNQVYEFENESNNSNYDRVQPGSPMHIRATPSDLVIPSSPAAPATGLTGQSITINWTVKNQGAFVAGPNWFDAVYLSADQTLDTTNDTLLASVFRNSVLGPGLTYNASATVALPTCISGTYHIFVLTDSRQQIFEFDPNLNAEANNSSSPLAIQVLDATPDLRVTAVNHPASESAGQPINVSWTIANQGAGSTNTTKWTDRIYLTPTSSFDSATALLIGSFDHTGALSNGQGYTRSESVTIPTTAQGSYFVTVLTDANNEVEECANNANNFGAGAQPITINNNLPDLSVQTASSIGSAAGGQLITVDWTVANQGTAAVSSLPWGDAVYFSSDAAFSNDDVRLATSPVSGPLAVQASYSRQTQVTLPVVAPGSYFLIVRADYLGNVFEGPSEANNQRIVPLTIQAPAVDLSVTAVGVPANAFAGQDMTVNWTIRNNGTEPTLGSHWIDEVVISLDQIDDPSDRVIGSKQHNGVLNGQGTYADSLSVFVPQGLAGQYYVFVRTDRRNELAESNESNNSKFASIVFDLTPPADLRVTNVAAPASGTTGEPITIGWTIENSGTNPATGLWNDAVYLSLDETWDINDVLIGRRTQPGPVGAGQSYNAELIATLPPISLGSYHVIVRTDTQNRVRETNEVNNTFAAVSVTTIDVTELQIGTPRSTTLVMGQERFYKTSTPANETVLFNVDGQPGSANELFTRFGQIATRNLFDFSFTRANEPDQEIVIQETQAGNYYNLVRGAFVPDATSQNVTVKAEIIPFEIRRVSPSQGGNLGFSTLTIDGGKFQPNATVKLISKTGIELLPLQIKITQSQIAALFDLRQKSTGTYDVVVTNPNGEVRTLADGFNIVQGGGHQLAVSVSSLESVRPNTYGRFTVSVRNNGLNDALLTPLFIFLPANADFRISRDREIDPLTQANLPEGINLEDVPISVDTDGSRVIPLLIPLLRKGDTLDISLDVLTSAVESSVSVRASVMPPMLTTDLLTPQPSLLTSTARYCVAQAFTDILFRIIGAALAQLLPTDCIRAIVDRMLEAFTIPTELALRNATGTRAGFSGWKSIGSVVFSFLYSTAICAIDLTPLKSLKVLRSIIVGLKAAWEFYKIGDLGDECTRPPAKPDDYEDSATSSIRRPIDPNEKVGPIGFGEQQFVTTHQDFLYQIQFENRSSATAYAQRVRITDQLDPKLDPRTLRLREIGFKQYRFQVPENRAFFQQRVQLGPDLDNLLADISAGVDITTGTVTWTLTALDPATGEQPNGANLGLLPPNNETNDGQGFVTFTVQPKSTAATGAVIHNDATITFDTEAPIVTNAVTNTIDAEAPNSAVDALEATQSTSTFTVSWSGADAANGSGLLNYDVFVSTNNGPYQALLTGTSATSTQFSGEAGSSYRFYSISRDNVGNLEVAPATADAQTTVGNVTSGPLVLMLDESVPTQDQVAGLDSVLFVRDPFPVINDSNLLDIGPDRNTRLIVFVKNLQLLQGEIASVVMVDLIDSNNQSYHIPAEDVRPVPNVDFTQVTFRLPDGLATGRCTITIRAHNQMSNFGSLRIRI